MGQKQTEPAMSFPEFRVRVQEAMELQSDLVRQDRRKGDSLAGWMKELKELLEGAES
jgi:hypothetical protein